MPSPALIVHGGAGTVPGMPESAHAARQAGVEAAADAGWEALRADGSALAAVLAAVAVMEDDPRFNAGRGSGIRADGSVQMDAAVATGDGRLGCIAALERTRYPVRVAAALLDERTDFLAGRGAMEFARAHGFADEAVAGSARPWHGDTVGAIARDAEGRLAVAGATGGGRGRVAGRFGDTPRGGAGFWCDDRVAVVATGIGEPIMRELISYRAAQRAARDAEGRLAAALTWGVARFAPEVHLGLIGLDAEATASAANTRLPVAVRE